MKFALGLACLMLVAWVQGAPPAGPPPIAESDRLPWCRTPPCPTYLNVSIPYPMDCLLYLECTQGVGVIKSCDPQQHFNEHEGTCMDLKVANCVPCWQKFAP